LQSLSDETNTASNRSCCHSFKKEPDHIISEQALKRSCFSFETERKNRISHGNQRNNLSLKSISYPSGTPLFKRSKTHHGCGIRLWKRSHGSVNNQRGQEKRRSAFHFESVYYQMAN